VNAHTQELIDILIGAKGFIERGWTQGELARDKQGNAVRPEDPNAVCWCVEGAIKAAGCNEKWRQIKEVLKEHGSFPAYRWNDDSDRTKEEVLEMLDKCATYLRNQTEGAH